jgi:hypothetical protein
MKLSSFLQIHKAEFFLLSFNIYSHTPPGVRTDRKVSGKVPFDEPARLAVAFCSEKGSSPGADHPTCTPQNGHRTLSSLPMKKILQLPYHFCS